MATLGKSQRHSQTKTNVGIIRDTATLLFRHKLYIKTQHVKRGKLTFVVQSPDVIVHLVQELRVQQVHSSDYHLHEQASC